MKKNTYIMLALLVGFSVFFGAKGVSALHLPPLSGTLWSFTRAVPMPTGKVFWSTHADEAKRMEVRIENAHFTDGTALDVFACGPFYRQIGKIGSVVIKDKKGNLVIDEQKEDKVPLCAKGNRGVLVTLTLARKALVTGDTMLIGRPILRGELE